jgi:D-glycero-D-manno-heptose 1,7-bisphosphate phosphatase
MRHPAVFLDKDGTIIENVPYNVDPAQIRWLPGAPEGLRLLHQAGYRLIVITNQAGVARGYFAEAALGAVEGWLREAMAAMGVPLTGFYYCPHHPEGTVSPYTTTCACRKPEPGMILRAARDHQIDLDRSWFIGDILHDIEAGRRAGCKTIMVDSGGETEWVLSRERLPDHITRNLTEAARVILALSQPFSSQHNGHAYLTLAAGATP